MEKCECTIKIKVLVGYGFALVYGNGLEMHCSMSAFKFTRLVCKNPSPQKDKCEGRRTIFGGRCLFGGYTCYAENLFFVIISNAVFPALHQYCLNKKKKKNSL